MKKYLTGIATCLLLLLFCSTSALAGNLNGAEARVYSAAGGTFSLEGKVYRAYGNYLSQVYSYLTQDGVDLTDEQANSAIGMMHSPGNILTAVNSGYVYQVGVDNSYKADSEDNNVNIDTGEDSGSDAKSDSQSSSSSSSTSSSSSEDDYEYFDKKSQKEKPFYDEKSFKASQIYKANKEEIERDNKQSTQLIADADAVVQKQSKKSNNTYQQVLKDRPEKSDSQTVLLVDEVDGTVSIKNGNGFTANLLKTIQSGAVPYRTTLLVICLIFLVVSAGLAVLLWRKKCFCFQKKGKNTAANTSHSARRKLRKGASVILSAEVAVQIFVLLFTAGMQLGFFRYDRVAETLSDSGSYHVAYQQMVTDVHETLTKENCMATVCDSVLGYEDFVFDSKNSLQRELSGKKTNTSYSEVASKVKETVASVSYITEEDAKRIGQEVADIYQGSVKSTAGICIYHVKNWFHQVLRRGQILLIINLILNIVLLLLVQHYAHRGVRNIYRAVAVSAIGMGICTLYLAVGRPFANMYLTPDTLYVFFNTYVQNAVKIFGLIFAGGIVAAVILHILSRFMRTMLQED